MLFLFFTLHFSCEFLMLYWISLCLSWMWFFTQCVFRYMLYDEMSYRHSGLFSFLVLQLFCSSPKPALRYAAVRTLNKVGVSLCDWHLYQCLIEKLIVKHSAFPPRLLNVIYGLQFYSISLVFVALGLANFTTLQLRVEFISDF